MRRTCDSWDFDSQPDHGRLAALPLRAGFAEYHRFRTSQAITAVTDELDGYRPFRRVAHVGWLSRSSRADSAGLTANDDLQ